MIGTLGRNKLINQLVKSKNVECKGLAKQMGNFVISTIDDSKFSKKILVVLEVIEEGLFMEFMKYQSK